MVEPGVCKNGCCGFQPCLNGGTCIEHCSTPKKKFTCTCPAMATGKVCENRIYYSCMNVLQMSENGNIPANGRYRLTSPQGSSFEIYCAFVAPNQAWTLIESFSLENKGFTAAIAFHQSFAGRNKFSVNWDDYRLTRTLLRHFRTNATMFRSTCDFPNRSSLTPDYLFGYLKDTDVINMGNSDGRCFKYAHINIRGQDFYNITAETWQKKDAYHFHLDVVGCTSPVLQNVIFNGNWFGYYGGTIPASKCTATPQATTQWWLGEQK